MEELIKEADEMYDKLMRVIRHINTPEFDKDDSIAIIEASQLLRRLVERKDNIVDLSEVWHEISVEPEYDDKRLVFECKDGFISYCSTKSQAVKCWGTWERVSLGATVRWAYVDDLLPKGGE